MPSLVDSFPDYYLFIGSFLLVPMDALYLFTITTLGLCALLRPRKIASRLEGKYLSYHVPCLNGAVRAGLYASLRTKRDR